jgi:hypothetical protein
MKIQEIQLDQISQIYLGKDHFCRCGCGGTYVSTSYMNEPRNDVNDRLAQTRLNRAKKIALNADSEVEYCNDHINIGYGDNRAITIYLDELKAQ